MRTACLFVAISLALSVSAASLQENRGFGNNPNVGNNKNKNNVQNGSKGNNVVAANSTSTAAGSISSANSTSTSNATLTSTATESASTTTSTSAATGSASNATSTATGTGADSGNNNSSDPQTSLTLVSSVIATGFENNGQDVPEAGQAPSLTSSNNYINFCATVPNLPITNGKQIATGSCNPAPMGLIPSSDNMPSAKFTFPKNGDASLLADVPFTVTMAIQNMQAGVFVNAQENYFAAPQQLNAQGQIMGHTHFVIQELSALDQTTPLDPKVFAYFKGVDTPATDGIVSASVTAGLPAGVYKLSSINTAANHQPVLVAIAQHGSQDDAVYFTVNPSNGGNGSAAASGTPPAASAPPASSATSAASAPPVSSATSASGAAPTSGASGSGGKTQSVISPGKKGKRFHSRALQ